MSSVEDVQVRPQFVLRGIVLIVAAMFVTSVQDVVFKLYGDTLTLGQIFTLRAILALPLFATLAFAQGLRGTVLAAALKPWPLLRSLAMTLMFLAFYAAIPFVSLSVLGAATYTAPLFVTLLSATAIGESVGYRGWIAVSVGFVGVLILLQPGTDAFSPWALLPLAGAVFYALAHVMTRARCQDIPPAAMALSVNLIMLAGGLAVSAIALLFGPQDELARSNPYLFGGWSRLGTSEWLFLGTLAILTVAISIGIAGAYQAAPPPTVATFEYSYLVFVAVWDLVFFAASPSVATLSGMFLIIAAGWWLMRRQA